MLQHSKAHHIPTRNTRGTGGINVAHASLHLTLDPQPPKRSSPLLYRSQSLPMLPLVFAQKNLVMWLCPSVPVGPPPTHPPVVWLWVGFRVQGFRG